MFSKSNTLIFSLGKEVGLLLVCTLLHHGATGGIAWGQSAKPWVLRQSPKIIGAGGNPLG